jgi:DNA-binding MarR family transcriptional regulator
MPELTPYDFFTENRRQSRSGRTVYDTSRFPISFDTRTQRRVKRLAKRWRIPMAEMVRFLVEAAIDPVEQIPVPKRQVQKRPTSEGWTKIQRDLVRSLVDYGPDAAQQLAARIGRTRQAVNRHLAGLVEEGSVEIVENVEPSPGRKTARVYAVTQSGSERYTAEQSEKEDQQKGTKQ